MSQDNSLDIQDQLPACYRCHASKVRCRRTPGQVRCQRCTRAAYSDCYPRPSRRGRITQQQTRGLSGILMTQKGVEEGSLPAVSSNMPAEPGDELHEQRHDSDAADPLLDLFVGPVAPGGDGLSDLLWTPLVSDFDPDSVHRPLALTTTTLDYIVYILMS
ncbi:hypothetical protein ASPFODRAFT_48987 [Aspergillus luchuensis CBS 106.47]|uniref:Zn(2)-C6 fungal-type domain-containing protein n=1 Tax=Aspergillus luchuensis (strain CBS 106.47) TaxID=1137211 RepID=A0A1M3T9Z4_ASPLC|nr:hypothetical protein ASPFODRAFT_48987 [Aspergillus luchuensis CBS 106.47]